MSDADNPADVSTAAAPLAPEAGGWAAAIVIALTFFVATAPTLTWLEFSSSMENLVAATALETRRTGQWLLPTLEGEPRISKPPLAAWISAGTIRKSTFAGLDDPDPARRDRAYRKLAWDIRWPGLLSSCVMLLAVFDLGRSVGGTRIGLTSMLVAGTTLYFLRFGRLATTDTQLALWVMIANAAIARTVLEGAGIRASMLAGAALGLALMSKGPVGLIESLVPAVVFVLLTLRRVRVPGPAMMIGTLVMLIVGGAWYGYVWMKVPDVWTRWRIEIARAGPQERSSVFSYASLVMYMLPWTPAFLFGGIWTGVEVVRHRREGAITRGGWLLALLMVVAPLIVLSLFPDRKERYLLPALGPSAVLAARGLEALMRDPRAPKIVAAAQWLTLFVIGVGFPLVGATKLLRVDGTPWFDRTLASAVAVAMGAAIVSGIALSRTWRFAIVVCPLLMMLALPPIFFSGYRMAREGRSDMRPLAEQIRSIAPDAEMHNWRPSGIQRAPVDLSIYLNRSTPWIGDASALAPSSRQQVLVTMQAAPPSSDWYLLGAVRRDKDIYRAFIRPAAEGAQKPR